MNQREAPLRHHLQRMGFRFVEILAMQDDFCAEGAGLLDFHVRREARHHDDRGNLQQFGVIGDTLCMVAGRDRDHASTALRGIERQQLVERATFLE